MKRLFLGIFIFAIISFLTTGILINTKINKNSNNNDVNNNNFEQVEKNDNISGNVVDNIPQIKEKTIDLNSMYDQNDLKIESATEVIKYVATPIKIPSISGLKNKEIENKINNDIRERIISKFNEDINKYTRVGHIDSYVYTHANFANVISIELLLSYQENGEYKSEDILLNYELIDGERLVFDDLFAKNADINSVVRRMLYRTIEQRDVWNYDMYDIIFDKEKGEWTGLKWEYDENTGGNEYRDIYIPEIDEYELYNLMNKFMKSEDKQFYFTPMTLTISIEDSELYHTIDFLDIAKDVVIYDKYLTEESIFENENIGRKNLFTCSDVYRYDDNFLEYGLIGNNLFYEIYEGYGYMAEGYSFKKSVETLNSKKIIESKNLLEKYKEIAQNNPDKFYVVSLIHQVETERDINIIIANLNEKYGYVSIDNKDRVIEDIKECYRYYNIAFYGSGLSLYFERNEYYNEYIKLENKEAKRHNKVYNAKNLEEITSIEGIFREGVDYTNILEEKLKIELENDWYYKKYDDNKKAQLLEQASFEMDIYGVNANFPDEEYTVPIYYNKFGAALLNIYDLSFLYVLPSNARLIEISEIENLSLEELNVAYNEIFARHGHDFKSNELKEYFDNLSWYYPISDKVVSIEDLNEIERANLNTIKNMIDQKKTA